MRDPALLFRIVVLFCIVICVGCAGEEAPPASGGASVGTSLTDEAAAVAKPETEEVPEEEDDGTRSPDESFEGTQNNARVIMSFDSESSMFKGTLENMGRDEMPKVQVTVQLSTGKELSTTLEDIEAGSRRELEFSAEGEFETWSVTADTGEAEEAPSGDEDPNS